MAKLKFKIPKIPPLYRLEPFQGINLSETETQISDHESHDMLNMNTDEAGALQKRTGYGRVFSTSLGTGKINGLYQFTKSDGTTVFLIAHKTELYTQSGSSQPVQIYTGKADADTSFFVMNDKCYILDGTNYLVYDGTNVTNVTDNPYVPTLTVARPPSGGGTAYEDFNLIGSGFKDSFSGDGTSKVYQLSLTNLDSTTVIAIVDNVTKTETTDFTVDRSKGKITFNTAPSNGTDNVIITAYKTQSGFPDRILNCSFNVLFGGSNDTRVFVSGNGNYRNQMWRSGLYDPTYFPENGYETIGSDRESIQGFSKQYDYLVIEKENSKWIMTFGLSNNTVSFSNKPINDKIGTIARKSIQVVQNNPISLDSTGVYLLSASNVREQTNVQHISLPIDKRLLNEPNLNNAVSIDFDKKYWLALNSNVYVFDYQHNYWYIYDNINPSCFYVADGYLYFGSNTDGLLYKFKKKTDSGVWNDDGVAINSYWYSKLLDFHGPEYEKMVSKVFYSLKPDAHTSAKVYLKTNKSSEKLINTSRMDQFSFTNLNFNKFSFIVTEFPQEVAKKAKEKKITHIQFKIENSELDESIGINSFSIKYDFQAEVK